MGLAILHDDEEVVDGILDKNLPSDLAQDDRWKLVLRIAASEHFLKSSRLPKLLLYLAHHTLAGDRHKLTEQMIGQVVFGKERHYSPAADSSVRVYVRQLRLRLHEYYHSAGLQEEIVVSIPKGGYALDFGRITDPHPTPEGSAIAASENLSGTRTGHISHLQIWLAAAVALFLASTIVCAIGWMRSSAAQYSVPWPLNALIHKDSTTTLVTADAGTALRMLGDHEVPLDSYIARSYLLPLLPKRMSENESIVLHYFYDSRITSEADVQAAAVLASLATPYADNLIIRSARDINANDLTHGDFIFVGSKTSNPWVELLDSRMNFQIVENGPHGSRYVVNRHPQGDEQPVYKTDSMATLASGDDYAVVALLPAKTGGGSMLVLEGVRMEGTKAAIAILQTVSGRAKLQHKLASLNDGKSPKYFEALLHAQSVGGANLSVDIVSARVIK